MAATKKRNLEIVRYLVQNGADVDAQDKDGKTALSFASMNRHFEMEKYLTLNGAKH